MRRMFLVPALLAWGVSARAAEAQRDARMEAYLTIWAQDANVTPATVDRLYGRRVVYYGRPMTAAAVFRDKLAFVRSWPNRRYDVVPGTVTNDCGDGSERCRVAAVIHWSRTDGAGRRRQSGTNTVRLELARQDGTLKIVRESGVPVSSR